MAPILKIGIEYLYFPDESSAFYQVVYHLFAYSVILVHTTSL